MIPVVSRNPLQSSLTSPWLLVLVLALSFYWRLGAIPLYDLDEGAFTEATREMLASGNFITPHRDGEPRYDKPVLIYWLQALSVSALDFDEFALRLPSALAATLWVLALWWFVNARLDASTATVAALSMTLSLQISLIAKAAVADAVLNLFIVLTFFEIYRYALDPGPQANRRALLRAYLWMGLGFLTKGPVAIFFPVMVSLLFFLSLTFEQGFAPLRRWLSAAFFKPGWLIFILIAGPWYLAIYLDDGAGFFRSFFLQHNAGRFGAPMHDHGGFPGYYLVVLPLVLLPFSGWFLILLPGLRAAWRDSLERFLWLWFVTVLVFFSFSATQLPHYLVYGLPPLFILMAHHREQLQQRWLAFTPPLLLFGLLLILPLALVIAIEHTGRAHEVAQFKFGLELLDRGYVLSVFAGTVALLGLALWSRPALWQRLILAGIIQTLVVYGAVVPRVFAVMQTPVKEAALLARSLDRPTVVYRTSMPSFSVYREAITPDRSPRPGDLVFLRIDKLERLERDHPELRSEILYQRGAVALLSVESIQ